MLENKKNDLIKNRAKLDSIKKEQIFDRSVADLIQFKRELR